MGNPLRLNSGFTQDTVWQPLGGIGVPNPFFYSQFHDDFQPYQAGKYTVMASGGSVAQTTANGTGGRILFTTGATIGNFAEIQVDSFGFNYSVGKKFAFLARLQLADIVNSAVIAGMISSNTTPFSAVADGIYFYKAAAGSVLQLIAVTGSTVVGSTNLPSGLLAVATDIDLGIYVNPEGDIKAFAGLNLIGQKRQNVAVLGPTASILKSALSGALSTANLTPTLAVSASTAAAQTMVADFLLGAQER